MLRVLLSASGTGKTGRTSRTVNSKAEAGCFALAGRGNAPLPVIRLLPISGKYGPAPASEAGAVHEEGQHGELVHVAVEGTGHVLHRLHVAERHMSGILTQSPRSFLLRLRRDDLDRRWCAG